MVDIQMRMVTRRCGCNMVKTMTKDPAGNALTVQCSSCLKTWSLNDWLDKKESDHD